MEEVYDFLKKAKTFFVATVDGDQPRLRPFAALDIFEGRLYLQTGRKKNVSKQIAINPKVSICACYEDAWIRVDATLVDDPRTEAQEHMLDANPRLKALYQVDDGNTQVLYLKDATATFSSRTEAPRTITF